MEHSLLTLGWPIDPSSIHRPTTALARRGLLHTLSTPGPVAYGLAAPLHHHAICTECATIIEIPHGAVDAAASATHQTLRSCGFTPAAGGLTIHGRCHRCLDPSRRDPTSSTPT